MRGRTYSAVYFSIWGALIGFSLAYIFFEARGDPETYIMITISGAVGGMILGSLFTPFFMPSPGAGKKAYRKSLLGGLFVGMLAWPIVGLVQGLFLSLFAFFTGQATLWDSITGIFQLVFFSITSELLILIMPLGWIYLAFTAFLGFLLTFRFKKVLKLT